MLPQLRPQDVVIDSLKIRAPAPALLKLKQELNRADWPQAAGESWVFIRKLQANAPYNRLAGELLAEAGQLLRNSSNDNNVIRFADLSSLLAALVIDLAHGTAAQRWYWQRWKSLFNLSISAAITNTFSEHILHLSSICSRLAKQQTLTEIWSLLEEDDCKQLIAELCRMQHIEMATVINSLTEQNFDLLPAPIIIPESLRRHWTEVLTPLTEQDNRRIAALLLIAGEAASMQLQHAPAQLLASLNRQFPTRGWKISSGHHKAVEAPVPSARHTSPERDDKTAHQRFPDEPGIANTTMTSQDLPDTLSITRSAKKEGLVSEESHQQLFDTAPSKTKVVDNLTTKTVDQQHSSLTASTATLDRHLAFQDKNKPLNHKRFKDFDQFNSTQGGLFYLLNFMNRAEVQQLMNTYQTRLSNAWGWLFRLGQTLQLNDDDPVVTFIANQLGMENKQELRQLPNLPAAPELQKLAQRWYGKTDLWQPELLQLQALIQHTPSHIDIHASINQVKLPVRLVGLDINPGWLPWLGRVVTFHYRS